VLIHAGRGIPALGQHTLELSADFPDAKLILAHAAVSDLSWIWRRLDEHPNVFIDSSWWVPLDLMTLFSYVPPGRILFASDVPYGAPALNAVLTLRCALQAGLSAEQIRGVCAAQLERLLTGETPLDLGPAPGPAERPSDLITERVYLYLSVALGRMIVGADAEELVALAALACQVTDEAPEAEICRKMGDLIAFQARSFVDVSPEELAAPTTQRLALLAPLLLATVLAVTPSVPAPREFVAT
jgi:hypothetical protein